MCEREPGEEGVFETMEEDSLLEPLAPNGLEGLLKEFDGHAAGIDQGRLQELVREASQVLEESSSDTYDGTFPDSVFYQLADEIIGTVPQYGDE